MTSRLVRAALLAGLACWLITAGLTPTEWLGAGQLILLGAFFWSGVCGCWVPGVIHRERTEYLTGLVEEVRRERDAYALLLTDSARTSGKAVDTIGDLMTFLPHEEPPC